MHIQRGEAMYISLIDFQWTIAETKSFQYFNNSLFKYDYLHQPWKYISQIYTKLYAYCSIITLSNLCYSDWWICNTNYTGLKGSNINQFWLRSSKFNFITDECKHNQMMNDSTIEKSCFHAQCIWTSITEMLIASPLWYAEILPVEYITFMSGKAQSKIFSW